MNSALTWKKSVQFSAPAEAATRRRKSPAKRRRLAHTRRSPPANPASRDLSRRHVLSPPRDRPATCRWYSSPQAAPPTTTTPSPWRRRMTAFPVRRRLEQAAESFPDTPGRGPTAGAPARHSRRGLLLERRRWQRRRIAGDCCSCFSTVWVLGCTFVWFLRWNEWREIGSVIVFIRMIFFLLQSILVVEIWTVNSWIVVGVEQNRMKTEQLLRE